MYTSKITVYQYDKPAKGKNVSLEFSSGFTKKFRTNKNGVAFIEHSSRGRARIYVNGSRKHQMNAPDKDVVYL